MEKPRFEYICLTVWDKVTLLPERPISGKPMNPPPLNRGENGHGEEAQRPLWASWSSLNMTLDVPLIVKITYKAWLEIVPKHVSFKMMDLIE